MYLDRCLAVEGHPSLPVGLVPVPFWDQDRCLFGLVCPAEGLFQDPKEVCALRLWSGHGLQCGGLGRAVGDCWLVQNVDAGVGFRRRRLLGISDRGGGPSPARAPSGVEEVDDTLSCGRLAAPLLGLCSRFMVLLWVASVTVPGPVLMRGSRLF